MAFFVLPQKLASLRNTLRITRQQQRQVEAQHVRRCVAENPLGRAIHKQDLAAFVDGDDGIDGCLGNDAVALLALDQRFLYPNVRYLPRERSQFRLRTSQLTLVLQPEQQSL